MKAEAKRWLIIDVIIAAVYFIVFFAVSGFHLPTAVWINLLFVLFSHATLWIAAAIQPDSRHHYVNLASMLTLCRAYVVVESLLGIILSIVLPNSVKTIVIIHVVLLLLFSAIFLSIFFTIRRSAIMENKQDTESAFINQMNCLILQAQAQINDPKVKTKCDHLMNLVKSSPYRSGEDVKPIEQKIISLLTDLSSSTETSEQEQMINEVQSQLELRNRILTMSR